MSATRVVVTGGAGFIGSHLVDALLARGDEVTVFDTSPPPPDAAGAARVVGDLRDAGQLAKAIRPGVEVVYHLAAVVGVDQYLTRPLDVIDIGLHGTRNVLDLAARRDARIVFASTSEVFGKNPAVPWREDADRVLGPTSADRWAYASAKGLAEHLTLAFARQHQLAATIVRYFNVYGPRQRPAYLVSRSIQRALTGRAMVRYDHGRQTRCFTYVADVVAGTLLAAAVPTTHREIFNIGSMVETTITEVLELIAKLAGGVAVAEVDTGQALGPAYQDLARRVPDTSRARELLGWDATTELVDGLARTIDWARANPWWLALPDAGAS